MKRKGSDFRPNRSFSRNDGPNTSGYLGDPRLLPRIRQYLEANKNKGVISVSVMADYLQNAYGEYSRRKKNAFRKLVEKGFAIVRKQSDSKSPQGDSYSKEEAAYLDSKRRKVDDGSSSSDSSSGESSDSDSFSSDNPEYVQYEDSNRVNSLVTNLYQRTPTSSHPNSAATSPARPAAHEDDDDLFIVDRTGETSARTGGVGAKPKANKTKAGDSKEKQKTAGQPGHFEEGKFAHCSRCSGLSKDYVRCEMCEFAIPQPPNFFFPEIDITGDHHKPQKSAASEARKEKRTKQNGKKSSDQDSVMILSSSSDEEADPAQSTPAAEPLVPLIPLTPILPTMSAHSSLPVTLPLNKNPLLMPGAPTVLNPVNITSLLGPGPGKPKQTILQVLQGSASTSSRSPLVTTKTSSTPTNVIKLDETPRPKPETHAQPSNPSKPSKPSGGKPEKGGHKRRKAHTKGEDSEDTGAAGKGKKKKQIQATLSTVKFADIGGNDATLKEVCKLLVHMKHPEVYQQLGVTPPRGFLLHGPPGCGKTLLAHAIAGELELPFIKMAATEIVSGVSGESEEKVRSVFDQAMACAPCILFLDEIDSITPKRETASKDMERRIVSQLLSCMDDLSSKLEAHVLVIGATNRPDSIDPALRRAGRFDREISMGIPNEEARVRILQVLCRELRLTPDFDYGYLARQTPGFVGADLMALAREAAITAVNRVFSSLQESARIEKSPSESTNISPSCNTAIDSSTKCSNVSGKDNDTVVDSKKQAESVDSHSESTTEQAPADSQEKAPSENDNHAKKKKVPTATLR